MELIFLCLLFVAHALKKTSRL